MRRHRDCVMRGCGRRAHYGWVVLVVATVGKIFTSPGQSPCIGVAIDSVRTLPSLLVWLQRVS